jgi:hypothetical protein
VRADLPDTAKTLLRGDEQYKEAVDAVEYRVTLAGYKLAGRLKMTGEFMGERSWRNEVPQTEASFRESAARSGSSWPWWQFLGCDTPEQIDEVLNTFTQELSKNTRYG